MAGKQITEEERSPLEPMVSGFYSICVWVYRFAYLNLLWVLFTLAGGIMLGFFPATSAMFSVERTWIRGEKDLPIHQLFWSAYKREFVRSNLLGYLLIFGGFLLVINYVISITIDGTIGDILTWLLIGLLLVYAVILVYIFPVFVHYNVNYLAYIKHAFVIGISSPLMSLLIVVSFISYFYLVSVFPGILLLYTGSILSFLLMWFAYCRFVKIEETSVEKA